MEQKGTMRMMEEGLQMLTCFSKLSCLGNSSAQILEVKLDPLLPKEPPSPSSFVSLLLVRQSMSRYRASKDAVPILGLRG